MRNVPGAASKTHPRSTLRLAAGVLTACALVLSSGCETTKPGAAPDTAMASETPARPYNLGRYSWRVTATPAGQKWFDQGLNWMYSFNHDEAVRSFEKAAEVDPGCAMAWWGVALCKGPHINNPAMDEASCRAAWDSLQKARALAANCTPLERALIDALGHRYADPSAGKPPMDAAGRAPLDRAYADAMAKVHAEAPSHVDVATLYAESLMDLRPWDLWSVDGEPRPETPTVVKLLEGVLAARPDHPGANHYYVHAVEASREPQRADAAATRLRTLVPDSGHMVHMPSHIDVRLGRWNLAAEQNEKAMRVHERYAEHSPRQGLYRAYMFHNEHFLSYACMMAGRREDAVRAARGMVASIPEEFYAAAAPVADAYTSIRTEALMRFGMWDEILAEQEPRAELPITRAMWRFARGVAFAAKNDLGAARAEQARFREACAKVPRGAMMAINPAEKVLSIADLMLEGEIRYREGDIHGAVSRLNEAIAVEDTLGYIEPPDWVQPVRHALGAVLLDAGRAGEAVKVYEEDLKRWPENGWALHGLAQALGESGRTEEAEAVKRRFERAWSRADTTLAASCFCSRRVAAK